MTDDEYSTQPPNDPGAEAAVLGAMLLTRQAIAVASGLLTPDDFYRPANADIYRTILNLDAAGEAVDPVTVVSALGAKGLKGAVYISDLAYNVPSAASAGYYAETVADLATKRRVIEVGVRLQQLAQGDTSGADAVDRAQAEVAKLDARANANRIERLETMLSPAMDELDAIGRRDGSTGIPTGLRELDQITQGMHGGQLIVIAGRPGSGKSVRGLDLVRQCAIKHGHTAALFSLEMSKPEIMMRLLSAEAKVPLSSMRSGYMSDDDWIRLSKRVAEIAAAPLYVDDSADITMAAIRSTCRRLVATEGLRLVVIDYLQLMSSGKKVESRQVEVSGLSRQLKVLAKDLGVPVVALAQLNRGPEQRTDKKPMLSDLRESGAIEQDSDVVILLHREDVYDRESPRAGEADLIVAKHRNGPTGLVTCAFQGHFSRFVDLAAKDYYESMAAA
jgi:replicative DNA helicase